MGMKTKVVAPIALSVGLLGIVGGVVAAQSLNHPAPKPAVQLVQPAAQTVTVTPSPTTTTPAPVKTTTAAPKVVPAPVQSTQAAPAPHIVQKAAVVSSDTSTSSAPAPAPSPTPSNTGKVITNPDGSTTIQMQPGQQPPVLPAKTPPPAPPTAS